MEEVKLDRGFEPISSDLEEIASHVVDCAFKVHKILGPGLLESVYETCLAYEIEERGIEVAKQVSLPINYGELSLEAGFRIDLLVNNSLILELKTVEKILPVHTAQLITYLKLSRCRLGFLINFNVLRIKEGITRIAL